MLRLVHRRILIGVSAWLLGAGAATGGSLLTVSLLGQGMAGASGSELTAATVSQALASASSRAASAPVPLASGTVKPKAHSTPRLSPTPAAPVASFSYSPTASVATPASPQSPQSASTDGTVLTSQGGEVVAACEQDGAYLISWSPQQAYEVKAISRGPAAQAQVTFGSDSNRVTMTVTCADGVPSATSTTAVDE
jgi:hypothetical protein